MSNQLQNALTQLASKFAAEVFAALRSMSLEELLKVTGQGQGRAAAPAPTAAAPARSGRGRGGRRGRRSSEEIGQTLGRIVELVRRSPGLRAEQIRAELNLAKNEIERPIATGLAEGQLSKKGQRRATKYFPSAGGAKKAGRRKAK